MILLSISVALLLLRNNQIPPLVFKLCLVTIKLQTMLDLGLYSLALLSILSHYILLVLLTCCLCTLWFLLRLLLWSSIILVALIILLYHFLNIDSFCYLWASLQIFCVSLTVYNYKCFSGLTTIHSPFVR